MIEEPWHCKNKQKNNNYCKDDGKYCNPKKAFGLDCYRRIDVIEEKNL